MNGDRYKGTFWEDWEEGRGNKEFAFHKSLVSYEGGWKGGKMHGKGELRL